MRTKIQVVLVLVLVINTALVVLEARPLSIIKEVNSRTKEDVDFFDGLSLGAMKQAGPSGPGEGHKFTTTETLGGIKDSGPSPSGPGHKVANALNIGQIKDSGPSSPGEGH